MGDAALLVTILYTGAAVSTAVGANIGFAISDARKKKEAEKQAASTGGEKKEIKS